MSHLEKEFPLINHIDFFFFCTLFMAEELANGTINEFSLG